MRRHRLAVIFRRDSWPCCIFPRWSARSWRRNGLQSRPQPTRSSPRRKPCTCFHDGKFVGPLRLWLRLPPGFRHAEAGLHRRCGQGGSHPLLLPRVVLQLLGPYSLAFPPHVPCRRRHIIPARKPIVSAATCSPASSTGHVFHSAIGLIGIAISFTLGIVIGGVAGYYGGWVDTLVQRLIEIIRSFPETAALDGAVGRPCRSPGVRC